MVTPVKPPAAAPCVSCPYRKDVPPGIWAAEEYEKLPAYDEDTMRQPPGLFMCHQKDGRVCAGWANLATPHTLALRFAVAGGQLDEAGLDAVLDYVSPVPCFATHAEAAEHGLSGVDDPDDNAVRVINKMTRQRAGVPTTTRNKGGKHV